MVLLFAMLPAMVMAQNADEWRLVSFDVSSPLDNGKEFHGVIEMLGVWEDGAVYTSRSECVASGNVVAGLIEDLLV